MRKIPGHGLAFDGHDTPRDEVLAAARKHLLEAGRHHLDVDEWLSTVRVARAWWTDEAGFVQEGHDGARPITVVPVPMEEAG